MRYIVNRVNLLRQRMSNKFVMPPRLKGTIIETWVNYWQSLARDYAEVAVNAAKESYKKPKVALAYASTSLVLYGLIKSNPDEEQFLRLLRIYTNRIITVSPALQNPIAVAHLTEMERAINNNQLRILSLGLFSLVWIDYYDKDDCTYPAICEYTTVGYLDFYTRVVDIGFCNQFWRLKWKMINYDINYL